MGRIANVAAGLSLIAASLAAASHDDAKGAFLWCFAGLYFVYVGTKARP